MSEWQEELVISEEVVGPTRSTDGARLGEGLRLQGVICSVFEKERGPHVFCSDPPHLPFDFDPLDRYLLPEEFLQGKVLSILASGEPWGLEEDVVILCAPVFVVDPSYERNIFQFSICLVVSSNVDTAQHVDLAQHLGVQFQSLEERLRFVSRPAEMKPPCLEEIAKFQRVLARVREQMNNMHQCFVRIDDIHCLSLRTRASPPRLPEAPNLGAIPVPLVDLSKIMERPLQTSPSPTHSPTYISRLAYEPDPMLTCVIPLIDSVRTIQDIVAECTLPAADVIGCVRHLVHFKLIALVGPIRAEDSYTVTAAFREIAGRPEVQEEIVPYVTAGRRRRESRHHVAEILNLYAQLDGLGTDELDEPQTLADFARRHADKLTELSVSLRHFVLYGLIRSLLEWLEPLRMPLTEAELEEKRTLQEQVGSEPNLEDPEVREKVRRLQVLRDKLDCL